MGNKTIGIIVCCVLFLTLSGCRQAPEPDIPADRMREFANELYGRFLFEQAAEEYRYYLDHYSLPAAERANITYRIADIFFERLHDYENALAEFLKIKTLYPESEIVGEVNKKIIACLERLGSPAVGGAIRQRGRDAGARERGRGSTVHRQEPDGRQEADGGNRQSAVDAGPDHRDGRAHFGADVGRDRDTV